MDDYVWEEVADASYRFFRLLIPAFEDRIPITPKTFPYTIAYILPLTFLAFLARRPDTRLIRLLLFPSIICMIIHSCLGYKWTGRGMHVYNWAEGLCCLVAISKALEFSFSTTGRLKVGERELGQDPVPAISKKDYDPHDPTKAAANGHARAGRHRPGSSFLPLWLQDGLELVFTFRGIGWDFGRGVHIPPERRPLEYTPFLLATFNSFLTSFIQLDVLESALKLVPGVGSTAGGSIFLPVLADSPAWQRYAVSTAIHLATGFSVLAGFQMCYDLATLVGVTVLRHAPESWPPIQDAPWRASSLAELWARRWHQLLRRTFLILGGVVALGSLRRSLKESSREKKAKENGNGSGNRNRKPTTAMATFMTALFRATSVLLTFIASGAFHEASAALAMGRGVDLRGALFFTMQGPLVLLEGAWTALTGRSVGGWPGRVWVWVVVGVLGQQLIDSWHMRGLAGGIVIPPLISPTRRLLFPLVVHLSGWDLDQLYFQD